MIVALTLSAIDRVVFPSSETPLLSSTSRTPLQVNQIRQMRAFASERRPPTTAIVNSVGKRSRTPTSMRTPTRHPNPTGTHSVPNQPLIHRTNSHSAAGFTPSAFPGSGTIPRSAKKWARSAHLHEVRSKGDREKSGTNSRDQVRIRDRWSRENDIGDVFQSPISPLTGYSLTKPIGTDDANPLIDQRGKSHQVFSNHHRTPLSPLPRRHSLDTDDSTENDIWVDTDGSELDLNSESEIQYSPNVHSADP